MGVTFVEVECATLAEIVQKEDSLSQQALGQLLERVMRAAGYTSDEKLAQAVQTERTNIQKLRAGRSGGSPELWFKISQVLGYPFESFMRVLVGLPEEAPHPDIDAVVFTNAYSQLDPEEREVVQSIVRLYLSRKENLISHDQQLLARVKAEMDAEARANLATEQAMREAEKKSTHNDESKEVKKS